MKKRSALAVFAALSFLALTPALPAPTAPLKGYVSDKKTDYFGYYLPVTPLRIGKWSLRNISFDTLDGFKTYETGKDPKEFAAVLLEFEDVTSPKKTNEMGEEYYTRSIRVLPTAYRVIGAQVSFLGNDKTLGAVSFEGTFDAKFLKRASNDVGPDDGDMPVLRGTVTVGGKTYPCAFTWFGGD